MWPKQTYISIVKPTRCTIFLVYWTSLYMFRAVFPSIIRSSKLYIQHHVYVIQVRWLHASVHKMELCSILCTLACRQRTYMTYTWCCVYSLELLMMDGKTARNSKKNCASSWFYYRNISRCTVPWTSNQTDVLYLPRHYLSLFMEQ